MVDPKFYNIAGPFNSKNIVNYLSSISLVDPKTQDFKNEIIIDGISDLDDADSKKISVFSNPKYKKSFLRTQAGFCIVANTVSDTLPNTHLIKTDNPYYAYSKLINLFYSPKQRSSNFIQQGSCYMSKSAIIGNNCVFGHNVVIEEGVEIGDNSFIDSGTVIKAGVKIGSNANIGANCYISYVIIGDDVTFLPGVCIGQDGFGFATRKGVHNKIFHIGRVMIGNNVEIGANTSIDRGSLNDTIIGDMCKIDNLVQIGHNVVLGKGCLVAGQVGIAGSTEIGDYCAIGGQVGVAGHLKIASQVQVAGGSGVAYDIDQPKTIWGGYPAVLIRDWHKQSIFLRKLSNKK
jgi:UDP-3-O-[3-hydroxymyristoyl] glucosamine N-acyltransferase